MFNFEKLDVWQKAIVFGDAIYSKTRDFLGEERFGLTNQMRRAGISVSSNIAEGSSRMSQTDFARFLEIGKVRCLKSCRNRLLRGGRSFFPKRASARFMRVLRN